MPTEAVRYELWPASAKLIVATLVVLVLLSILPWLLTWTGMRMNLVNMKMSQMKAASLQMMQAMGGMMQ